MQRSLRRRLVPLALAWAGVLFFLVYAGFPIYWMVMTALKTDEDLVTFDNVPFWFSEPPTLDHFRHLFSASSFLHWTSNSVVIAVCVVAITMALCVPAAYALARLPCSGVTSLGTAMFITYLAPPTLLFIGLARIVGELHLWNSKWGLVVIYPTLTIPFCLWLLMTTFRSVPPEVEEAAWVDGCTRFQAVRYVMLPLSIAGVLTVAMFAFTLAAQEFFYAATFVSTRTEKPLTGIIAELIRGDVYFWGSLMAGALVAGMPLALIYNFCLERFVHSGAVRGA